MIEASKRIVKGVGPKTSCKICFVGEAPGAEETRMMQPFVGVSGELLTRLMRQAGIIRGECYITNVIKERPNANDIGAFITFGKTSVSRTTSYDIYEEALKEELSTCSANIFVAVGKVSMYALTSIHDRITKRRGSLYTSTLLPGKKVMPIIHPAAALRQYEFTNFIQFDLMKVRRESEFPELQLPKRQLITDATFDQIVSILEKFSREPLIAFDIETKGFEVSHISLAPSNEISLCIPFITGQNDTFTPPQEAQLWEQIARILEDPKIRKIAQNGIFDFSFLFKRYGIVVRNLDDTMVAQAIISPDLPKGLDFICSIYTKEPYYKDDGKVWMKFGEGEQRFREYSAKDSIVLHDALPHELSDLERLGNTETYHRHIRLIEPLIYMSERGIRMDVQAMKEESGRCHDRIVELQAMLNKAAGCELNPLSHKQLTGYFYANKGYTPYKSRSTGNWTVDEKALTRLSRKGAIEASIILEMRRLSKLKSTYLDVNLSLDGRLHCAFNPVGTENGRLSSSKTIFGLGTNMQNQPKRMRKLMLPDIGYLIYDVDLEQSENRIVAHLANEEKLILAFKEGRDIHCLTAGTIFGKPPNEVSDEDGSASIGGGVYSERFWGKKANHSLNYDMGYKLFALTYEISEKEAKVIVDAFHQTYPRVRHRFHRRIQELIGKGRQISNPFGRTRRFTGRWGTDIFKEAYAFIPQSTVADIINEWGILEIYEHQSQYGSVELLNQVHDSIVFQIPIQVGFNEHERILRSLKLSLEQEFNVWGLTMSIPIKCKVGAKNLYDTKTLNFLKPITTQLEILLNESKAS